MITVTILIGLLVSACAGQRRADAQAAIQARVAECRALYPPDTHYLDRARCEAPVRLEAMQSVGTYGDLIDSYLANRSQIAAEIDAGRLTKEQANVKISEVSMRLDQIASERNERRAMAAAAILSSMPRPYQAPAYQVPFYPITFPTPVTTNCMRIGLMVNCSSN
jgi:hypothetical protein